MRIERSFVVLCAAAAMVACSAPPSEEASGTAGAALEDPPEEEDSVEVQWNGARWRVTPTYVAPVGIGEAEDLAAERGCELPTPGLVDAIWKAADVKVAPIPMSPNRGNNREQFTAHKARVDAQLAGRSFRLLAGTHKDVVRRADGRIGLYGWHRLDGRPIQPFFSGHAPIWKDYSQGFRCVRRLGDVRDRE